MYVKMRHAFAGIAALVDHEAVTGGVDAFLASNFGGHGEQVGNEGATEDTEDTE